MPTIPQRVGEMLIGIIAVWYLVGVAGFLYWYTSEFDFTSEQVLLAVTTGLLGPISWVVGYAIHGKRKVKVIIRSRAAK